MYQGVGVYPKKKIRLELVSKLGGLGEGGVELEYGIHVQKMIELQLTGLKDYQKSITEYA